MSTKFFNNTPDNSLFEKFKGIAHNMLDFHTFQAVVGYFRSSGYFKLREEFEQVKKIQILVGINIDNIFRKQSKLFFGQIDEQAVIDAYSHDFVEEVKNAGYDEQTERAFGFARTSSTKNWRCVFIEARTSMPNSIFFSRKTIIQTLMAGLSWGLPIYPIQEWEP